jgi:4-hydroxy-L-threonine phosphate dehydrogenase PdxA
MKPIAITMGDPCGIGPEICAKLFADGLPAPAFLIGDAGVLRRSAQALGLTLAVRAIATPSEAHGQRGTVDVLSTSDLPTGRIDARAGQAAYDYVVKAIDLANAGAIDAIVTAPIAKEAMKAAGIPYPGHTEILADKSGTSDFAMMLANDELRSILVSIHVSLAEAIRLVTRERVLKTIRRAWRWRASILMLARRGCSDRRTSPRSRPPSPMRAPMASTPPAPGQATPCSCVRAAASSTSSSRSTTIKG